MPETGLLIVNADDFGGNPLATDRIAECFRAGTITSTSAMMHMNDSKRAASIAKSRELPVGLHLNLTQPFDDPRTPRAVRERQAGAARRFAGSRVQRLSYNPFLSSLVRACIADQLECFRALYDREPTHIDGHNHVHLSPTVLLALPAATCTRTAESPAGATSSPGALLRRARGAFISRRYTTTDRFVAIDRLGSSPSTQEIDQLLALADRSSLEIMTHPDRERDHRLLMSERWRAALKCQTLGSFAALRATASQ
ncbi:MAG: ChbG/HpnK family deacetylase [Solirubrobacteraceae bacterium]